MLNSDGRIISGRLNTIIAEVFKALENSKTKDFSELFCVI